MDKAPEKLWMTAEEMGWPGSFRSFRMSDLEHPEDEYPAYVRADLYEQVKRELEVCQHDNASYKSTVDHLKQRAEAAERLAGARVVTDEMVECALVAWFDESTAWDREMPPPLRKILVKSMRAAINAALAEPAGEAEPVKHGPGCGSHNDYPCDCQALTAPPDASAIRGALEKAERSLETIRNALVNCLSEPERTAFWEAVDARNALRATLAGAKP